MTQVIQKILEVILNQVPRIYYLVQFRKNKGTTIQVLINSGSKVNTMTSAYVAKLGLKVCSTNIGAQKIDGSLLRTFGIVIAGFPVEDKFGIARFFQELFLLADTSMEVVLEMLFLTFGNVDIQFAEKELTWRSYTTAEALPITKQMEFIDRREFAKAALDEEFETFLVHVIALKAPLTEMTIYPLQEA